MAVGKGNVGDAEGAGEGAAVGRAEDGAGEGREEGVAVVGAAVGMAEGREVGSGLGDEGHTAVSDASFWRPG